MTIPGQTFDRNLKYYRVENHQTFFSDKLTSTEMRRITNWTENFSDQLIITELSNITHLSITTQRHLVLRRLLHLNKYFTELTMTREKV